MLKRFLKADPWIALGLAVVSIATALVLRIFAQDLSFDTSLIGSAALGLGVGDRLLGNMLPLLTIVAGATFVLSLVRFAYLLIWLPWNAIRGRSAIHSN